jgi:hypothetical protein
LPSTDTPANEPTAQTRACSSCGKDLAVTEFPPRYDRGPGARQSYCRRCDRNKHRELRGGVQTPPRRHPRSQKCRPIATDSKTFPRLFAAS